MWNRVEDRTSSKLFHHPLPPPSFPLCVFSPVFVCIFVDEGACIINEASLEESPSYRAYRAVTNSVEKESRIELCRIGHRLPGRGRGKPSSSWKTWKTFDQHPWRGRRYGVVGDGWQVYLAISRRNNKAGINAERRNMVEEGAGESEG